MENQTTVRTYVIFNSCDSYMEGVIGEIRKSANHVPAHYTLDYVILPVICIFGILGNVLNIFILSRKHINSSLDRMERSVYTGLLALAVSDLLQCILFLTFLYRMPEYVNPLTALEKMHLFFYANRVALIDIALFGSTWLTVLMAVGRYVGICHPINARGFVKLKVTLILIVCIFVTSVGVSLPYFFYFEYKDFDCSNVFDNLVAPPGECNCTIPLRIMTNTDILEKYNIFWILIEFLVPLAIMIYCTIYLVMSLKQSYRMQRECRATRVRNPSLYITPTLVAIIVFFVILIAPVEILKVIQRYIWSVNEEQKRTIKSVINILQCLNAAMNFILYSVINVHFRKTIRKVVCRKEKKRCLVGSMRTDQIRTNHTSFVYNTTDAETEL